VPRNRAEPHHLEQNCQFLRVRVREFDELEAIGAGRIVGLNRRRRRIMRKRTHRVLPEQLF
jgi:hypothetical protein